MTQLVRDLMTPEPAIVDADERVANVARLMRDQAIGAVIVVHGQDFRGIVTDRDIAIRAVAEEANPGAVAVGVITSGDLITLSPNDSAEDAAALMRSHAMRRLPVLDSGIPVGIVSIGDLAEERDPTSVLADISTAPANR